MTAADRAVILLPRPRPESSGKTGSPLQRILGLTLLQRTILASAESGIREFFLIGDAGHGWEEVAARLKQDRRIEERGLRLEFIPLAGPTTPLREALARPFWLLRGNLVFDPALLARAARTGAGGNEGVHLVCGLQRARSDASHGTGVKTGESPAGSPVFVRLPREGAAPYAGISLCPPSIGPRLAATLARRGDLRFEADGLNEIFLPAASRSVDVGSDLSLEISNRAARRRAARRLLNTARKSTDSFFSRHFNRYVSLFLTKQFLRLGIAPNVLSIVCLAIGLSSGWFIGRGGYASSAVGALLFEFASIFDGCDGEVARLTFRTSRLGGFLDMLGDASTYFVFFLSLPFGLYRSSHHPAWIVLGLVALVSMGTFYVQLSVFMKRAKLGNNVIGVVKDVERSAGNPGFTSRLDAIAAKIGFIYRRDFFSTMACLIILVGGSAVLMGLLAVFMPLEAVYLFFFARRRLAPVGPAA